MRDIFKKQGLFNFTFKCSIFLLFLSGFCFAKYSGGTGEPNDPYQIGTIDDILSINNDTNDSNKCFILIADINLASSEAFHSSLVAGDFNGVFDGAGHEISNLVINGASSSYLGFFRIVHEGQIINLGLENVSISAGGDLSYVGGLTGKNDGNIINCYMTGNISGGNRIGGLVGLNYGNIRGSYSIGTISGSFGIGGIAGYNSGKIYDCKSNCTVSGSQDIGGIVGQNYGTINKCYSAGFIGGGDLIGGLIGESSFSDIDNSYSTCAISGNYNVGGLIGTINNGDVNNCYASGTVTGNAGVGGLISAINNSDINNCYSSGIVTATLDKGGLIGYYYSGHIYNCYFLNTSGKNNGYGTPLTDSQMKLKSSFINWDFAGESANGPNDIWSLCNEGMEYPKLKCQYLPGDIVCPGITGIEDIAEFCNQWLNIEPPQFSADLYPEPDGDGNVNFPDFSVLAGNWQKCFVGKAVRPTPIDGTVIINRNFILQWSGGQNCVSHDIYFGTDFNNINNADTSTIEFMGNQKSSSWNTNTYASSLNLGKTYFWRVDEKAIECNMKGDVWKLSVQPLGKATNPKPLNGYSESISHPILIWSPATYATSHNIYLGTDINEVNNADANNLELYIGNIDTNFIDINTVNPNGLNYNTTYYWRVDELESTNVTKGDIWNFTTLPVPDINYGLVDWWKFEEANGLIAYDSIGGNDGNLLGGTAWTTGKKGYGVLFDGINDYINCGSGPNKYDTITVSAWIKTSAFGTIISNNYMIDNRTWYALTSRSIQISYNTSYQSFTFNKTTTDNLWHQVVYVKTRFNNKIYIDGILDLEFTSQNSDISGAYPVFIGRKSTYTLYSSLFTGVIDEVRIYNRDLSAEEIILLYSQ